MTTEQDETILGQVNEDIMAQIGQLQHHVREMTYRIGNMELQKQDMMHEIRGANERAHDILREAAKELGVPPDSKFQLLPDGRLRQV